MMNDQHISNKNWIHDGGEETYIGEGDIGTNGLSYD